MKRLPSPLIEVLPAPDGGEGLLLRLAILEREQRCTRLELSLLMLFDTAGGATIDDVCAANPHAKKARAFFEACTRSGFLVEAKNGRPVLPDTAELKDCFLHAPAGDNGDFVFVGVPFDKDVTGRAGAKHGPAAVRAAAAGWRYALDPLTLRPRGFFDLAAQKVVLAGASFADRGDVLVWPGDDGRAVRARLTRTLRSLLAKRRVPLVVGGDHSITRGVIDALDEDVTVVHLDAHTDLGDALPGDDGALVVHHGNVMSTILEECPQVRALVQCGLRGIVDAASGAPVDDRVVGFGIDAVRADNAVASILAAIPADRRCWLSVDIDVVDPAYAPATGTPVPDGMLPRELVSLVSQLVGARDFIGIDVVEVAESTGPADGTGGVAAACLFAFCRAIVAG